MEDNRINKVKTYLVVMIFVLIIILSAYIVIKKATSNSNTTEEIVIKDKILDNSSNKLELSLNNKVVNNLYKLINDNSTDYLMYNYKNKQLDWDIKSFITVRNIDEYNIKDGYINEDIFKLKYKIIFGTDENINLDSDECGSASYDEENNRYVLNEYCLLNKERKYIQTYLKDIIMERNIVKIRKYYSFVVQDIDGYNIYSESNTIESNLIAMAQPVTNISSYIDKMNTMAYVFKKGLDNNYYLDHVE